MSLEIEIEDKPAKTDLRVIRNPSDVNDLDEINEIRNKVQEVFLMIGLDRGNHIRKICLKGIGPSSGVYLDSKDLIRTALINSFEKVVFVHNHPSNNLRPSEHDKNITNITGKLMEVFGIEFVDHIIVAENGYVSMLSAKAIDKDYTDDDIKFMNKAFLIEENNNLKLELETLKNTPQLYEDLKQKAKFKVEEYDDYMRYNKSIEDYTAKTVKGYLLDYILEYINNDDIIGGLAKQFERDYPGYIESIITSNSVAIYATEHKEEYLKLGEVLDKNFYNNLYLEELEMQKSKQEYKIKDFEENLKPLLEEQNYLKNRKYKLVQLFNGDRKKDKILQNEISIKIKDISVYLEEEKKEYESLNKKYGESKQEQNNINKIINNISDNLKYDYKAEIEKKISDKYYLHESYDLETTLNTYTEYKTTFIEENKKLEKMQDLIKQTEIKQAEKYSIIEDEENEDDEEEEM